MCNALEDSWKHRSLMTTATNRHHHVSSSMGKSDLKKKNLYSSHDIASSCVLCSFEGLGMRIFEGEYYIVVSDCALEAEHI